MIDTETERPGFDQGLHQPGLGVGLGADAEGFQRHAGAFNATTGAVAFKE